MFVMEDRPLLAGQATKIHWIEYYARKQRRVVRSTFSAELNAAADAYEVSRLISLTLSALWLPATCTARSLGALEAQGQLPFSIDLYIDCRSILDSLRQEIVKVPSEQTLILLLLSLKEALLSWSLRHIAWVSTGDMLADGLNKGIVSRRSLVESACSGTWTLTETPVYWREPIQHIPQIV